MKGIGDCYEVHVNYLLNLRYPFGFKLCHGVALVEGPIKGIKHNHCWIELPDMVVDISNGQSIFTTKERYYEKGNIDQNSIKRYTLTQMKQKIKKYKHYGPWED